MQHAVTRDRHSLKLALVKLCSTKGLKGLDETVCRGIISIACGEITAVEDIAATCKVDIELAEGLVRITGARAQDDELSNYKRLSIHCAGGAASLYTYKSPRSPRVTKLRG